FFVSKRGFKFHYEVTSCGGNLTASEGVIVSPDITHGSYITCIWRITVPEEKNSVALRITELDLANDHCRADCCNSLRIYDGFFAERYFSESNILGYLCT